jgi:hypothetical protein
VIDVKAFENSTADAAPSRTSCADLPRVQHRKAFNRRAHRANSKVGATP